MNIAIPVRLDGWKMGVMWFCSPWWFFFFFGTAVIPHRKYWGAVLVALLLVGGFVWGVSSTGGTLDDAESMWLLFGGGDRGSNHLVARRSDRGTTSLTPVDCQCLDSRTDNRGLIARGHRTLEHRRRVFDEFRPHLGMQRHTMILTMQQVSRLISVDEYLGIEEISNIKHEYDAGEIFAMAGASIRHNDIALNIYTALRQAIGTRGCRANVADLRLRTPSGLYAYPDVIVICGTPRVTGERPETVENPVVLVEVLSDGTARYDRTRKFEHYRSITTLRDYLLVEQDIVDVEQHSLRSGHWVPTRLTSLPEAVHLESVGVAIPLREIYAEVPAGAPR